MSTKYIPTTWVGAKTVATADVMNNIEKGISDAHDRLDGVDEQFNTIANKLDSININIKDFEHLVVDGDWTNAIKTAYNNNLQKRQLVYFPPGVYKISETIEINVAWVYFMCNGSIFLYDNKNNSNCGFKLTSKNPYQGQPYYQSNKILDGMTLINVSSDLEQNIYNSVGVMFEGTSKSASVSHISLGNCCVVGFDKATEFKSYSYLITFNECDFHENNYGGFMDSGYTDYGENIRFNNCCIYHNKVGLYNDNGNGDFVLSGTSLDYNSTTIVNAKTQQSRIRLVNCHLETNNDTDSYVIENYNGSVIFTNSLVYINIKYKTGGLNKRLFYCNNKNNGILFNSCFINIVENNKENISINYDLNPSFTDGEGIVKSINGKSYNTPSSLRLLSQYNKGMNNKDFIKSNTSNIEVIKETGTNKETGGYSWRFKKTDTSEGNVTFYIPLSDVNNYPFSMYMRVKSDCTNANNLSINMYTCLLDFNGNEVLYSEGVNFAKTYSELSSFTTVRLNLLRSQVSYNEGNYLAIKLNLNQLDSTKSVWIDRIIVDSY